MTKHKLRKYSNEELKKGLCVLSKLTLNRDYCLRKNDGYYMFLKDTEMVFISKVLHEFCVRGNLRVGQGVTTTTCYNQAQAHLGAQLACESDETYQLGNELLLKFYGAASRRSKTILVDGCNLPNPMYGKNKKYKKSK
jgi:hypothetical protein